MAEIKTVDQVIKDIGKQFEGIVQKGFTAEECKIELISLGSISLDFCLYGGIRSSRVIEISGGEGSGKSTLSSLATASFQRAYPDEKVLYMDLEGTFDPTWAEKLGVRLDSDHFIYYQSFGQSGEVILNHLVSFLKAGVRWIVIDSLPKLVPEFIQEEDNLEQKSMGGNAKLLADFVNRYSGLIHKQKAIIIGINQLRDNMSQYGDPYKTTGGRAWKHECSVRLMVKRGDFFDQNGEKVKKKDAQSPAGHYIEMYVLKNKDAPWDRKLGFTKLHYWKGIDYVADLLEVAIYFNLIDNSKVGWFGILNEDGTPMLDENGKEIRLNGRAKLAEYLKSHREVTAILYKKVRHLMEQKGSTYIKGFEEMLGAGTSLVVDEDGDLAPVNTVKIDKETGEVLN